MNGLPKLPSFESEYFALMRAYSAVQLRASALIAGQRAEIEALQAREMRSRAEVLIRDSSLAWAREDHARVLAEVPGLPRRLALARRVEALVARIQGLMRERLWGEVVLATPLVAESSAPLHAMLGAPLQEPELPAAASLEQAQEEAAAAPAPGATTSNAWPWPAPVAGSAAKRAVATPMEREHAGEDYAALEASLTAADLVICQAGCLSHNAYWRVQDHCRRTGKPCVLVEHPDSLRIVRIHEPALAQETQETSAGPQEEQA